MLESAWARGWSDAKRRLADWRFWAAEVLGGGLVGMVANFAIALVFVIGLAVAIWVVATVSAPIRQRNEARSQLKKEREERVPRLVIEFASGPPCEYQQPPTDGNLCFRHFSVRIKNISTQPLSNCVVEIVEMRNEQGVNLIGIPASLKRRATENEVFPLRPGQYKYIDVVSLNETASDDANIIIACWRPAEQLRQSTQVPQGNYRMTLQALSAESQPAIAHFRVRVDDEGRLCCERQ